jgi:hypothetical protein
MHVGEEEVTKIQTNNTPRAKFSFQRYFLKLIYDPGACSWPV